MNAARAVFVDRDGVINELIEDPRSGKPESPLRVDDVRLIPGASAALRSLAAAGWLLVGVSNQPSAAKGVIPVDQLRAVHQCVLDLLAADRVQLDHFELCLHHPQGTVPDLTKECGCRKPRPGMLFQASRALQISLGMSWMVGDTDADIEAGSLAGCQTVLVANPGSAHKRSPPSTGTPVVPDLAAAAALILSQGVLSRP